MVLLVSFFLAFFQGLKYFEAALLGGAAWLLPSWYFARRLFSDMSPRAVGAIVRRFYGGEMLKLVISAGLVVLVIKFIAIPFGAFLTGYITALLACWLAPLLLLFDKRKVLV